MLHLWSWARELPLPSLERDLHISRTEHRPLSEGRWEYKPRSGFSRRAPRSVGAFRSVRDQVEQLDIPRELLARRDRAVTRHDHRPCVARANRADLARQDRGNGIHV